MDKNVANLLDSLTITKHAIRNTFWLCIVLVVMHLIGDEFSLHDIIRMLGILMFFDLVMSFVSKRKLYYIKSGVAYSILFILITTVAYAPKIIMKNYPIETKQNLIKKNHSPK